jgi:hypothetical protein
LRSNYLFPIKVYLSDIRGVYNTRDGEREREKGTERERWRERERERERDKKDENIEI